MKRTEWSEKYSNRKFMNSELAIMSAGVALLQGYLQTLPVSDDLLEFQAETKLLAAKLEDAFTS